MKSPGSVASRIVLVLVAVSTPALAQSPVLSKSFGAATINLNGTTSLTFTLANPTAGPLTGMLFTDVMPAGLAVLSDNALINNCGGLMSVDGTELVSLSSVTLAAGASCTLKMNVVGVGPGIKNNQTSSVSTVEGPTGAPAAASIEVLPVREPVLPPTLAKSFGVPSLNINGKATLTFTLVNSNPFYFLSGIHFTDVLPAGLAIGAPNALVNSCGGVAVAVSGSPTIALSGASLSRHRTCSIAVSVAAVSPGTLTNVTSAIAAAESPLGLAATAPLTVTQIVDPAQPPLLTETFAVDTLDQGATTTVTFTLTNPNSVSLLNGVGFTDTLPAGLIVGTPAGIANGCGGVAVAQAGSQSISLTGVALPAAGTCTLTVRVTGVSDGDQTNTTSPISSIEGGVGLPASATIAVRTIIYSDAVQVHYFSNLYLGGSEVVLTNTGALTLPNGVSTTGNICVNIYSFDASEELLACCSCLVTPNGLNSFSARYDSFTLTPGSPNSVVITLIATTPLGLAPNGAGGTCNPSSPTTAPAGPGTFGSLVPGLRAWGTTIHALPTTPVTYGVTESEFERAPISVAEFTKLVTFCGFIQANGSGFGICKSCRTGGSSGASR